MSFLRIALAVSFVLVLGLGFTFGADTAVFVVLIWGLPAYVCRELARPNLRRWWAWAAVGWLGVVALAVLPPRRA